MSISVVSSFAAAQELPGGSVGLMTQGQSLDWEAGLDGQFSWTNDGYNFTGSDSGSGWAMQWNMLASGTASAESIVTSFTVINTGSTTETFYLHFHQAIMGDYATGSLVGGSIAGTFTDLNGNGVSVSALSGGSIYSALVDTTDPLTDGTIVGTLLDGQQGSASGFGSGNFLSESFGNVPSIPGANGPPSIRTSVCSSRSTCLQATPRRSPPAWRSQLPLREPWPCSGSQGCPAVDGGPPEPYRRHRSTRGSPPVGSIDWPPRSIGAHLESSHQ